MCTRPMTKSTAPKIICVKSRLLLLFRATFQRVAVTVFSVRKEDAHMSAHESWLFLSLGFKYSPSSPLLLSLTGSYWPPDLACTKETWRWHIHGKCFPPEREKKRAKERQKDRKTERQKDRETEREESSGAQFEDVPSQRLFFPLFPQKPFDFCRDWLKAGRW